MTIPLLVCRKCGSKDIRRSRPQSAWEMARMIPGIYPFRCHDCKFRFLLSIWLFSKFQFAKCPKCLSLDLTTWSRKYYKAGLWMAFLITFGAQKYRCTACRCNFVSFLPRIMMREQPTQSSATELVENEV